TARADEARAGPLPQSRARLPRHPLQALVPVLLLLNHPLSSGLGHSCLSPVAPVFSVLFSSTPAYPERRAHRPHPLGANAAGAWGRALCGQRDPGGSRDRPAASLVSRSSGVAPFAASLARRAADTREFVVTWPGPRNNQAGGRLAA